MVDRSPDELRKGAEIEGRDAGFRAEVENLNDVMSRVRRRREMEGLARKSETGRAGKVTRKPVDDDDEQE